MDMAGFADFSSTCDSRLCRGFHGRVAQKRIKFPGLGSLCKGWLSINQQSGNMRWHPDIKGGAMRRQKIRIQFGSGKKIKAADAKNTGLLDFFASWWGEHLECSPCGELAVSCVSVPVVEGGRCRRCCCRACGKKRIIPLNPRKPFVYAGFGSVFSWRDWASNSRKRSSTAGSLDARATRSAISLSRLSC